ncbi:hypothetical protein Q1695_003020 [Nippostrongylus brasiliensis]|nr:hypothetical protein Q1695_003020 [Nippostrongylus brasiliensis]
MLMLSNDDLFVLLQCRRPIHGSSQLTAANYRARADFGNGLFQDVKLDVIDYLMVPRERFCSNASYVVFLLISVEDAGARYQWRLTYASTTLKRKYNYEVMFVIGKPRSPRLQRLLYIENELHGDMLLLDVYDVYRNLTLKTLAAFRYIVSNCKDIKTIIKMDDDVGWNIEKTTELSKKIMDTNSIHCHVAVNATVHRSPSDKWVVTVDEWNHKVFPDYCCGMVYAVPFHAARKMLSVVRRQKFLWLEDVFLTGVLREVAGVGVDIGLVEICVHHLDDEECHRTRAETDRARVLAKVKCPVCDDVIITHKELAKHCLQVHPEDGVESRPQDYSAIKE